MAQFDPDTYFASALANYRYSGDPLALEQERANLSLKQQQVAQALPQKLDRLGRTVARKQNELGAMTASFGAGSNALVEGIGTLGGLATGNMNNAVREQGKSGREYYEDRKPLVLALKEQARTAAIQGESNEWAKAGRAIWETAKDPTLFSSFLAEQVPMLIPGGAVGRVAGATGRLVGASEKVARYAATGGALATGASLQGADVAGGVFDNLMEMPAQLWDSNEEYQALIQGGMDPEKAKHQIAISLSRKSGLASAGVSLATASIKGGRTIENLLAGGSKAGGKVAAGVAIGLLGEAAQEAAEEGGGAFIGNVAKSQVNPEQSLTEGVGESAGLGALGGGTIGGVAGGVGSAAANAQEKFAKKKERQDAFTAAATTGDIAPLLDPENENLYDPKAAAGALMARMSDTKLSPEERAEAKTQLDELPEVVQYRADVIKEDLAARSEQSVKELAKYQGAVDQFKTAIENEPDATPERKAELAAGLEGVEELLEKQQVVYQHKITDPQERKKLEAEVRNLEQVLPVIQRAATQATEQTTPPPAAEPTATTETPAPTTSTDVEVAQSPEATPERTEATKRIVDMAMSSPETLTDEELSVLSQNTNGAFTKNEAQLLRTQSDARIALNAVKEPKDVTKNIMTGADGFVGLKRHLANAQKAIARSDSEGLTKTTREVKGFLASHTEKAAKFAEAAELAKDGSRRSIVPTVAADGKTRTGWQITKKQYSDTELKKAGGLWVNPKRLDLAADLLGQIETERDAISAVAEQVDAQARVANGEPAVEAVPVTETAEVPVTEPTPEAPVEATEETSPTPAEREVTNEYDDVDQGGVVAREDDVAPDLGTVENDGEYVSEPPPQVPLADEDGNILPDEGEEDVSPATPEVVEEEGEPEVIEYEAGTLSVFAGATKAVNGLLKTADFLKTNLVQAYVGQRSTKDGETEARPLVDFRNFLTALVGDAEILDNYLPEGVDLSTLTQKQIDFLALFQEKMLEWVPIIEANFKKKNEGFADEDYMNYFLNEDGTFDENLKVAIAAAAFTWLADNANLNGINDETALRSILGLSSGETLPDGAVETFGDKGTTKNAVSIRMGESAMQMLAMFVSPNAPANVKEQLVLALGNQAVGLLLEVDMLAMEEVRNSLQNQNKGAGETWQYTTMLRPTRVSNWAGRTVAPLHAAVKAITDAASGTTSILSKLLGATAYTVAPEFEATEFNQPRPDRSKMSSPEMAVEILTKAQKEEYRVRKDSHGVLSKLSGETLRAILGYHDKQFTHVTREKGVGSNNDSILRELENWGNMLDRLEGQPLKLDTGFYFTPYLQRHQRVGNRQNTVNAQTNKFQRHAMTQTAWAATIQKGPDADPMQLNLLKMIVAQGLGIKTDKLSIETVVGLFDEALETDADLQAGLAAVTEAMSLPEGETLSQEHQDAIIKLTLKEEKAHTLDALITWAGYQAAEGSYEVQSFYEVDGLNNGPALALLQLAISASPQDFAKLAEKFGFFTANSKYASVAEWKADGNQDLYETVASYVAARMQEAAATGTEFDRKTVVAFETLIGQFADEQTGAVSGKARNIVKHPLVSLIFGAGTKKVVKNMGSDFIESLYEKLEEAANNNERASFDAQLAAWNVLIGDGPQIRTNISYSQGMKLKLTPRQEMHIQGAFQDFVGVAVETALEAEFKPFLDARAELNKASNLAYGLYEAAFNHEVDQLLDAKQRNGEIPTRTQGKEFRLQYLTQNDLDAVAKKLTALRPIAHTAMSSSEATTKAGLFMGKEGQRGTANSDDKAFQQSTNFSHPIDKNNPDGVERDTHTKSLSTSGRMPGNSAPGVAIPISLIHGLESYIAMRTRGEFSSLHLHDAQGFGLNDILKGAQALNRHTLEGMINYSMPTAIADGLATTLEAFLPYLQENPQLVSKLDTIWEKALRPSFLDKQINYSASDLLSIFDDFRQGIEVDALNSERAKLNFLKTVTVVDQFTLDGGQFKMDAKHLQMIEDRLAKINAKQISATTQPTGVVEEVPAAPQEKDVEQSVDPRWGAIGPSPNTNQDLVNGFKGKRSGISGQETVQILKAALAKQTGKGNENAQRLYGHLLNKVGASLSPKLKVYIATPNDKGIPADVGVNRNSAAWYAPLGSVSKDNTRATHEHILMVGPEFSRSRFTIGIMLHELLHAGTSNQIHIVENGGGTKAAKAAVADLEAIRAALKAHIAAEKKAGREVSYSAEYATKNIKELLAVGMTEPAFVRDYLAKLEVATPSSGGKLTNMVKAFTEALSKLMGGNKELTDAISLFISSTTVLLDAQAADVRTIGRNNKAPTVDSAPSAQQQKFTPTQIFDALSNLSTGTLSHAYTSHLKEMLATVVRPVFGPMGALQPEADQTAAATAQDVYINSLTEGRTPYSSPAIAMLGINHEEAYVLSSVELAMREALNRSQDIRGAMRQLFDQAKALGPEIFVTGDWSQATPTQQAQAEQIHKFIFTRTLKEDGTSEFLARFAAMGVAYKPLHDALGLIQPTIAQPTYAGKSLAGKLKQLIQQAMQFIRSKINDLYVYERGDARLKSLVQDMARLEARKRAMIRKQEDHVDTVIERGTARMTEAGRAALEKFGDSKFFNESRFNIVQATGHTISTLAGGRIEQFTENAMKVRNSLYGERQGPLAATVSEIKGLDVQFQTMLRMVKHHEKTRALAHEQTKQLVNAGFARQLSETELGILTRTLLQTDMQSLLRSGQRSLADIQDMLSDPAVLATNIAALEGQLSGETTFYIEAAKELGYLMATGAVTSNKTVKNAYNIGFMVGTEHSKNVTEAQANAVIPVLDELASMYAIQYSPETFRNRTATIMGEERRNPKSNGIDNVLKLHTDMVDTAFTDLFDENPIHVVKGYTKDIHNPHVQVRVADEVEGTKLVAAGYSKGAEVRTYDNEVRHIYKVMDGGLQPYVTAIFSNTGMRQAGSAVHDGLHLADRRQAKRNRQIDARIRRDAKDQVERSRKQTLAQAKAFDPRKRPKGTHVAPVFNMHGEVTSYAHLMEHGTKKALFDSNIQLDEVMGNMAGSAMDKVGSRENNRKAVNALKAQYDAEYANDPDDYIEFGQASKDPSIVEAYRLLPESTKKAFRDAWGKKPIMIRKDLLDINFGYRKVSLSNPFTKDVEARNAVEAIITELLEALFGKTVGLRIRQGEDVWQAIVKEVKDAWVIKNLFTLVGNTISNVSLLVWMGVPIQDIVKGHVVAAQGMIQYSANQKELFQLERMLNAGIIQGSTAEMEQRVVDLKDTMSRSPVRPLVEAGMFSSIIEDIETVDDGFSYKSKLVRKVDQLTEQVPPFVKEVGKTLYMAHDTPIYQALNHATQLSDFMARYTLHEHQTKRTKNPLGHEESLQKVSEAFINYDIPTHRQVQYINDMGLIFFTKYYLRIQKILFGMYRENPARALGIIGFDQLIPAASVITESSFWERLDSNPFTVGPLEYWDATQQNIVLETAKFPLKAF